ARWTWASGPKPPPPPFGQSVVIVAGADPLGTSLEAAEALRAAQTVIAVSLFPNATTERADIVLPRQSVPERDGTFTSGERRVQRFYTAQGFLGDTRPDWKMFGELRRALDPTYRVKLSAAAVMAEITQQVPLYQEMSYKALARVERQFPDVGGEDLYYGGTAYGNRGGLGLQWPVLAEDPTTQLTVTPVPGNPDKAQGLLAVPVRRLYDRSPEFLASEMMHGRIPAPYVEISRADAAKLNLADGDAVTLAFGEQRLQTTVRVDGVAPEGAVLIPQNLLDAPIPSAPTPVTLEK
ncbi:MAG: molybdopterin-dependent oxidoreductase, partial [Anaerolineae bacterium]|nr:molybdopterin-dependent oxidoreductase [Anaerolineae bacterium]